MVAAVDRLPPHNLEAEQSVLGSILLDRDSVIRVAPFLKPEDFYQPANGQIFKAITELYDRREPTDVVTLTAELKRRGTIDQVGGAAYLAELIEVVPTSVHIEYYAHIVERTATLRRLITAGAKIVGLGYREDLEIAEALDEAERSIFDVAERRSTSEFVQVQEVIDELFDKIENLQHDRGATIGVPTGFVALDRLTGGLQRSDLIVIAARPSFGKSSLAIGMAHSAAVEHQRTVGIFSLEMQAEQVVQRLLSIDTGVEVHKIRVGQINDNDWVALGRGMGRVGEAQIFIDDSATSTVMDIKSKSRRLQAEHGLDLIIVDYLQLMSGGRSENRVQQIAEISRGLKTLARELDVPVIALSQLSRAVENRTGHRPMLSDLRESGAIEQDADIVIFIHREDKFDDQSVDKNLAEIIIAKHRNGPIGTFRVRFLERIARFADFEAVSDQVF